MDQTEYGATSGLFRILNLLERENRPVTNIQLLMNDGIIYKGGPSGFLVGRIPQPAECVSFLKEIIS